MAVKARGTQLPLCSLLWSDRWACAAQALLVPASKHALLPTKAFKSQAKPRLRVTREMEEGAAQFVETYWPKTSLPTPSPGKQPACCGVHMSGKVA